MSLLPIVIASLLGFMPLKDLQKFGRRLPVAHGDRRINRFLHNFIQVAFRCVRTRQRRQTIVDRRVALPGFINSWTHISLDLPLEAQGRGDYVSFDAKAMA